MASSPPTLAANATDAQALAYLSAFWGTKKFTSPGKSPYNGKTAAQIYAYIKQQHPTGYTPYQYAQAAQDVMLSAAVGQAIGEGVKTGATAIGDTQTGVQTANYGFTLSSFLSALTASATWVRVAKVIVGGGLVLIGVAHMTGASDAVSTAARRVPLPV